MSIPGADFYYPNKMGRIILLAMEEILGRNGINAVLHHASLVDLIGNYPPSDLSLDFSFSKVSQLQSALETAYGPRGGRGLSLRVGRACFRQGLREFGTLVGLTDATFRLLPMPAKLSLGLPSFAEIFNRYSDQRVRIEQDERSVAWIIERCPVCWQRRAEDPACHLAVGLLQESLYWASGGKYFDVQETDCIARGDRACTFRIDKNPMS